MSNLSYFASKEDIETLKALINFKAFQSSFLAFFFSFKKNLKKKINRLINFQLTFIIIVIQLIIGHIVLVSIQFVTDDGLFDGGNSAINHFVSV